MKIKPEISTFHLLEQLILRNKTARERKIKKLDKVDADKMAKDDYQSYLPHIIKASIDENE